MSKEKRSSNNKTKRTATQQRDIHKGVGGRRIEKAPGAGGGGYLDICKKSGAAFHVAGDGDPRLQELMEMGLGALWIRVAHCIGVDRFLTVWEILDEENSNAPPGLRDQVRLRVPLFSRFMRYQRNKLILSLEGEGLPPSEIQRVIKRELCEEVTTRHISRIIEKHKIKP